MNFLPVDYYVLLQENFEWNAEIKKTNYIMFKGLPLLTPSKTVYSSTKMKHVTYEDITWCGDSLEIKELLDPKHSITEIRSHLEQFGDIEDVILFDILKDD